MDWILAHGQILVDWQIDIFFCCIVCQLPRVRIGAWWNVKGALYNVRVLGIVRGAFYNAKGAQYNVKELCTM